MLDKAIELARKAHDGQVDKGGHSYINHPLRVMNNVETVEEKIVAVLHDAVEDEVALPEFSSGTRDDRSDLTLKDLRVAGFDDSIVNAIAKRGAGAIAAITKREGEKRKDYLSRVALNKIALRVKIADMTDNADISRISNQTLKDRERTRIYKKNIIKLQKKLDSYVHQSS